MRSILTSHVTQLLYSVTPQLNFAHVISELCEAFTPNDDPSPVLTWDCDDIAVLDFVAARVVVGFTENIPGAHVACLTVATGQSPLFGRTELKQSDQILLCNKMTEVLDKWFPSTTQHRQVLERPLTPDMIDELGDALFQVQAVAPLPANVPSPAVQEPPTPLVTVEPSDMDRLMLRLSSELVARPTNIIARAIASAAPKPRNGAENSPQKNGTVRPRAGLFWGKSAAAVPLGKNATAGLGLHPTSSDELKAVRDALCAGDAASQAGNTRLSAQTRHMFQTLSGLSHGLASAVSGKRQAESQQAGDQIKN